MNIMMPEYIEYWIRSNGHEAYVVGSWRIFFGVNPEDWDIATSALPNEVLPLFTFMLVYYMAQ